MKLKSFSLSTTALSVLWGIIILIGSKYYDDPPFWIMLTKLFIGFVCICLFIDLLWGIALVIKRKKK